MSARQRPSNFDLLVFPELSLTGYHVRDLVSTVALDLDSPEMAQLKEWSQDVPLIVGFVEESVDFRFYNSAAYIAGGEVLCPPQSVFADLRHV